MHQFPVFSRLTSGFSEAFPRLFPGFSPVFPRLSLGVPLAFHWGAGCLSPGRSKNPLRGVLLPPGNKDAKRGGRVVHPWAGQKLRQGGFPYRHKTKRQPDRAADFVSACGLCSLIPKPPFPFTAGSISAEPGGKASETRRAGFSPKSEGHAKRETDFRSCVSTWRSDLLREKERGVGRNAELRWPKFGIVLV